MKKLTYLLSVFLISLSSYAQDIGISQTSQSGKAAIIGTKADISAFIKQYVEQEIAVWQKKGEFEKTAVYKNRVNEISRKEKSAQSAAQALKILKEQYIKKIQHNDFSLSEYDADNETFLINSAKWGDFVLPVDIKSAPVFKNNWPDINIKNPDFVVSNNKFVISKLEFYNPYNGVKFLYDSKQSNTYALSNIEYNFGEIVYEPDIQEGTSVSGQKITEKTIKVGKAKIDTDIPVNSGTNANSYALIIGNEDYKSYQTGLKTEQNVEFAKNDAEIFKQYCIKTLGIPKDNIIFEINAGYVEMKQALKQIYSVIKNSGEKAEVIIYYAGHGLPDEQTKVPYLIPVNVTGSDLSLAISLKEVCNKLIEYPAKKVIVFLDACFTGGARDVGLLAARGIKIKPKDNLLNGNLIVFSASSGTQSSLPYRDKGHGIFTYYLLKKLHDTKGDVTLGGLDKYIGEQVSVRSPITNKKEQNPKTNISTQVEDIWKEWKMK